LAIQAVIFSTVAEFVISQKIARGLKVLIKHLQFF